MARILVIDDDPAIRELLSDALGSEGHTVILAREGDEGEGMLESAAPDLVLLDVNMPGRDGWEMLRVIRERSRMPVIMLTAHDGEAQRVHALYGGADDYLAKPFSVKELQARVWVRLRERGELQGEQLRYDDGDLMIDAPQRTVLYLSRPVRLTGREFALLSYLVHHRDRAVSKSELLANVWDDPAGVSGSAPKTYVSYLRSKFDAIEPGAGGRMIRTEPGFGYRFVAGGVER